MIARLLPGAGVDRPRILVLTAGHVGSDVFQGALPAMVPFFVADRDWSYAQAGVLVLIGSLGSSLLQPLAGMFGDRIRVPWLVPLGLLLAAAGLLAASLAEHFALVAGRSPSAASASRSSIPRPCARPSTPRARARRGARASSRRAATPASRSGRRW